MKQSMLEVQFRKPIKLVQIFSLVNEYGKDDKSFDQRRLDLQWPAFDLSSGFVQDGLLHLPESITTNKRWRNCRMITIEDRTYTPGTFVPAGRHIQGGYDNANCHCFSLQHPNYYEMFSISKEELQLSFRYSWWQVGDPHRDSHVLALLHKGKPVEVKLNGKFDLERGRHFKEQSYIFHYLGDFDRALLFSDMPKGEKRIPAERKTISLLKRLY